MIVMCGMIASCQTAVNEKQKRIREEKMKNKQSEFKTIKRKPREAKEILEQFKIEVNRANDFEDVGVAIDRLIKGLINLDGVDF